MGIGPRGKNMSGNTTDDLLAALDTAPLTKRYWISIALLVLHEMFDYFDFSSSDIWSRFSHRSGTSPTASRRRYCWAQGLAPSLAH
jgi:hypothetical protein